MHASRLAMSAALLGLTLTTPLAAGGASFQVGITIVSGCDATTSRYVEQNTGGAAISADCSANAPYYVSIAGRPLQDGRPPAPMVPQHAQLVSRDQEFRIATMTF